MVSFLRTLLDNCSHEELESVMHSLYAGRFSLRAAISLSSILPRPSPTRCKMLGSSVVQLTSCTALFLQNLKNINKSYPYP